MNKKLCCDCRSKKYNRQSIEKTKETQQTYRETNKEIIALKQKQYRKLHKKEYSEYQENYHANKRR